MRYHWKWTAAGLVLVLIADRLVDGELAGLLSLPDETEVTSRAPEVVYVNTVSSSSTNAVIGVSGPTEYLGL